MRSGKPDDSEGYTVPCRQRNVPTLSLGTNNAFPFQVKLTDTALALLFHEAHQNFLRGLYPCDDHGIVMLAANVMQILHGDYDSKRDKLFLSR